MPLRLGSVRPVFHVFFHHKMLDDYTECHPTAVESQEVCEEAQQRQKKGKKNLRKLCRIVISFNPQWFPKALVHLQKHKLCFG